MRSETRYRLRIRLEIEEFTEQYGNSGNRFNVSEDLALPDADSFLAIAAVLGRFHDLAKEIELGAVQEDAERDPEQALTAWASVRRDDVVRVAHAAGVSKNRIHTITGIARTTIDRILEAGDV